MKEHKDITGSNTDRSLHKLQLLFTELRIVFLSCLVKLNVLYSFFFLKVTVLEGHLYYQLPFSQVFL